MVGIVTMLFSEAALAALSDPVPSDHSRSPLLSHAIVVESVNARVAAAESALRDARFEDCVVAASEAQELAHSYTGFLSDGSQRALALIADCAERRGNKEELSQALTRRLVAEGGEFGETGPRALQDLRVLALFHTLHGNKAEALQWQALYVERLEKSVGSYDPRYPTALFFLDLAQPQPQAANDRLAIAAASVERAREALRIEKAIFGSRHPVFADGLAWLASRHEEWLQARGRAEDLTPGEEKRLGRQADSLYRDAFQATRRARGDQAAETLALASTLSERAAPAKRVKLLEYVAVHTARKDGPNHPAALVAAFDHAMASKEEAQKRDALEAIAERAIGLEDTGSPYGFYMFKVLVSRFELWDMDQKERAPEWTDRMDRLFTAVSRLSAKAEGYSNIPFLQRQLRYRLRNDRLKPTAGETARQLYEAAETKRRQEAELTGTEGQENDAELAPTYRLVAQSLLKNRGQADPVKADADLAFAALQASLVSSASKAQAIAAGRNAAGSMSDDLGQLVRRREPLREEIQTLSRRFAESARLPGGPAFDSDRFIIVRAELEAINQRLRSEFPAYFSFIQPAALPIADTMRLLAPDEALVMLVPDGRQTHVFAVNHEGYKWVAATHTSPGLELQIQRLLWDLGAGVAVDPQTEIHWANEDGDRFPYHRGIAWQLYRELIEPVSTILQNRKHIFFVQGGELSSLPMSVLVTRAPAGDDADPEALRNTAWLVDDYAISILPSVQSLALIRDAAPGADSTKRQRFIGFGDPLLQGRSLARGKERMRSPPAQAVFRTPTHGSFRSQDAEVDITRLRSMNRLPGTARELNDISKIFGPRASELFLADAATEAKVKQTAFNDASVIAFATHGILAGEIRGATEPGLVMTPPAEPSIADDGYLSSSEISALRMKADWVILSACNTAGSDGLEGAPGLSGLARSFLYAGASSLLVSHWPVRDDVAARLTVDAIRRQRETPSGSAADAVRASMLTIRNDRSRDANPDTFAHPNAWAPFSLVGDLRISSKQH